MSGQGYIYIPNWDGPKGFQHYGNRRPSWIKNYLELLDNDAYLDLSLADRGVLHAIWMLVARVGQGRCIYSASYLQKQCNAPAGHMRRSLERLNQAGFIEVRASRALAAVYPTATPELEEGSKEPSKKEIESARANGGSSRAAAAARHRVLLQHAIAGASNLIADLPPHLVEGTIKEAYPADLVPGILAGLPKPATKETSA